MPRAGCTGRFEKLNKTYPADGVSWAMWRDGITKWSRSPTLNQQAATHFRCAGQQGLWAARGAMSIRYVEVTCLLKFDAAQRDDVAEQRVFVLQASGQGVGRRPHGLPALVKELLPDACITQDGWHHLRQPGLCGG